MQKLIHYFRQNPPRIFLADCGGAFVSALLLYGFVLAGKDFFGLPVVTLLFLAGIATLLFLYSLSCYLLKPANWRPYLLGVILGNSLYCLFTFISVFWFYKQLSPLGLSYFILELIVIASLIYFEVRVWLPAKSDFSKFEKK
jgi:hypothetical protein